jgi:hypothetical protein
VQLLSLAETAGREMPSRTSPSPQLSSMSPQRGSAIKMPNTAFHAINSPNPQIKAWNVQRSVGTR